jgi:endonuclease/exonuclease/phosphatase family metal-dependent hydrolase
MTYNIRYNNPDDNENQWNYRKQEMTEMIKFYQPEILSIQEGVNIQVKYLDSALTNYSFVGVGRNDGKEKGEFAAIYFDTTKYELIETETFWLSQTPTKVSIGWDASMERICTYGAFFNKNTKDSIFIFNCHFDHIGKKSRKESSHLILQQIKNKKIDNKPIVVTGDFNCLPPEEPIRILYMELKDACQVSQYPPYGPFGTFNSFNIVNAVTKKIDYIMVKNITVKRYITFDDIRKNNLWLSDHLPILIQIE